MEYFRHIPCGHSLPENNPHAVSVNLPATSDVVAYEECDKAFMQSLQSGYPRFFVKHLVRAVADDLKRSENIPDETEFLPVASDSALSLIENYFQTEFRKIHRPDACGLLLDPGSELYPQVKYFIQHSGIIMSSRKAEDYLLSHGLIESEFHEQKTAGPEAEQYIKKTLSHAYGNSSPDDVFLCSAGTNAVYSIFSAIKKYQAPRGRKIFIRFGWLYTDTIEIIRKYSEYYAVFVNVTTMDELENYLKENGKNTAALFTEFLTNPLIEAADLPRLSALAKKYGFLLVVDSTIATPFNAEIMEYADVAAESLTKFACGNADVLMGAVILNANSCMAMDIKEHIACYAITPYIKDIRRLACEIENYEKRAELISQNTAAFAVYLEGSKKIREVHYALGGNSKDNYRKVRKNTDAVPGLVSIVFDRELDYYYDRLPLAKGPSFGSEFTLAMPYVLMAHYEMLKTAEGRRQLAGAGLDPGLLRISVGAEPVDELIRVFENI